MSSFELGDNRKTFWVDSLTSNGKTFYYPFKYKISSATAPATEYENIFRLAEQYLIRAEAEISTNPAQTVADLNVVRTRAGLPNYAGLTDAASLKTAILHERQVELFTEFGGFRWLDLKRSGTADAVMGPPGNACAAKGGTWSSYKQLYPIPLPDINLDHNLTQNPGY